MKWMVLIVGVALGMPALAQKSDSWWRSWDSVDRSAQIGDRLFSSNERRILHEYLRNLAGRYGYEGYDREHRVDGKQQQKPLPPGLQKKLARGGELPPGWQKKVARGEVLDRSLYAASSALPPGVARQLRHYEGTSVRRIDDRVVRIIDATGVILDVLSSR